jgi:hypothetical protein
VIVETTLNKVKSVTPAYLIASRTFWPLPELSQSTKVRLHLLGKLCPLLFDQAIDLSADLHAERIVGKGDSFELSDQALKLLGLLDRRIVT